MKRKISVNMKTSVVSLILLAGLVFATGCYPDESVSSPVKTEPLSTDPLDVYIRTNFAEKYGVAVRYKFVDRYVEGNKRVVPPRRDAVEPMLDFLTEFWIEPFIDVPNGEEFFTRYVPAEIVLIGSPIFNNDGTVTLGTADAGARITLTEVNLIDSDNEEWVFRQLGTIYHEFAHIVHQNFNLPPNFQEISPEGYTSAGSWYNLPELEAHERGFVSSYATSSFNEDFAETVAHLLFRPDFYEVYINDEPNCTTVDCEKRNEGRVKLRRKYNAILAHYQQYTGIDLLEVRELIQAKL
jgi:substrate import-associated zinc metallohydrolase lipoprotein